MDLVQRRDVGLSVHIQSGDVHVFSVLGALLHLSNMRLEVLHECANLSDSSRTGIQEGRNSEDSGDLELSIEVKSSALLKSGIFCIIKLLSSQSTALL